MSYSKENELERASLLRKVDVESVGAGGGSVAWIHEDSGTCGWARSAGAVPGPTVMARAAPR